MILYILNNSAFCYFFAGWNMSNIQHHNQIDIFHRYTPFRLDFLFCFVSHSPISIFRCIEAKIKATSWHDHNLDLDSWSLQGKTSIDSMHWWFWSIFHKHLQWVRSRCSFLWWVPDPELKSKSYRADSWVWWFSLHCQESNCAFSNEGLSKRETFALARTAIDATFAENEVKQQLGLIFDSASPEYV